MNLTILKKVVIHFVISFVFVFSIQGQKENNYSLLWKIEGNGLEKPSYLFGTMHVKDKRAFNFSDAVMKSIKECSAFALEIHPDSMMSEVFKKVLNPTSTNSIKDLLTDDQYLTLKERLSDKGYDLDKLNLRSPFMLRSLLGPDDSKEDDKATFVDAYLLGIAKTMEKEIFGLEKVEDQVDLFLGASKDEQKKNLISLIDFESENYSAQREQLINLYLEGDIDKIGELVESYNLGDAIMLNRNIVMANSIEKILENNTLFAAVGAAHLPGKNGVIDLLQKKGYEVTKVKAIFTGEADKYKIDQSKMQWPEYKDEELGFSVLLPGNPISVDIVPGLDMKVYPDLTSGIFYSFYSIDMRGSNRVLKEEEMVDKLTGGLSNGNNNQLIDKKTINKNGLSAVEVIVKNNISNYMRMQIIIRNNVVYCLFVGNTEKHIYNPIVNKFFDSFQNFKLPPKKSKQWYSYVDQQGAYSLLLPFKPKDMSREITNPQDPDGEPFRINLLMSTDLPNLTNYLIAYNDFPSGYYMEDKQKGFEGALEEFKSKSKLLSDPDTIWLDGIEGREYELMLNNSFYTICRVYIRGNRIYKLLKQSLNVNQKNLKEDDFFSSFSFESYEKPKSIVFSPENEGFEIELYSKARIVKDTSENYDSYLKNIVDCYSTNPNSGGVYVFEYSDFKELYQINNLDSFYVNFSRNLSTWKDSVTSINDIVIDDIKGKEVIVENILNKDQHRYRIWVHNNKLFYLSGFFDKNELFSQEANDFFNSFKKSENKNQFDLYSSKTDKILNGLLSTDSNIYKSAIGAFGYYKFKKEDIPSLQKAIAKDYKDDDSSEGAKCNLIFALGRLKDEHSISFFEDLYKKNTTTDQMKIEILLVLNKYDVEKANLVYNELFLNNLPEEVGNNAWRLIKPYQKDKELAIKNLDKLSSLVLNEKYKNRILNLVITLWDTDPKYHTSINNSFPKLTKLALEDLAEYDSVKLNSDSEYYYKTDIYSYLRLLNRVKDNDLADKFTSIILRNKGSVWVKNLAVTARLNNDLKVDKKLMNKMMSSMDTRFSILEAYNKLNQLDKVPKKYLTKSAFAKLRLYNHLNKRDELPEEIIFKGNITLKSKVYYVYSFYYYSDKEDKVDYIGVSGGFNEKNKSYDFNDIKVYTKYEIIEQDWQKQAEELIKNNE